MESEMYDRLLANIGKNFTARLRNDSLGEYHNIVGIINSAHADTATLIFNDIDYAANGGSCTFEVGWSFSRIHNMYMHECNQYTRGWDVNSTIHYEITDLFIIDEFKVANSKKRKRTIVIY